MIFVLDCSVAASWLLPDEVSSIADAFVQVDGGEEPFAFVPYIWPAEIANTLLTAERRGRINRDQREEALAQIGRWPVTVVDPSASHWNLAYPLALRLGLSYYDALYLRLAQAFMFPLATFDKRLAAAAQAIDVDVVGLTGS